MTKNDVIKRLGLEIYHGGDLRVTSPLDGSLLGAPSTTPISGLDGIVASSVRAFEQWRTVPAPRRGELVRLLGEILRREKEALGMLVTLECGKIIQEGLGEVQEMIDICDFAVGLSRQLYGLTIASERPGHRMSEFWHPIGPVGVISAFNFPVAVWAWNAALALICGDSVIWKPSEKTPLTALACQKLFAEAAAAFGDDAPDGLLSVVIGDGAIGEKIVSDRRIPVISATGSTAMGRKVGPAVAERFGRSILELGGNNGLIVCPGANLDLAVPATVFGAVGTAGQRCTSTRRLFVHDRIYESFMAQVKNAFSSLRIGDPTHDDTLVGPLIDEAAYTAMQDALREAKRNGAVITGGDRVLADQSPDAYYVRPALLEISGHGPTSQKETFAPILHVYRYTDFTEVLARHNDVPQGLSSAIFTSDILEAEHFLSVSDCGIANVNIGTSGAEIGGAFGGEKETGGGRESGSDAWKGYMRRMTSTINYSRDLPLAQGITFDLRQG